MLRPIAMRKLNNLRSPIQLHLGCGFNHLDDWVNIDLVGASADIYWDLRKGIPFASASAAAIFHEHLLEHLPYRVGFRFTKECYRVLRPEGILRVVVPSATLAMERYGQGEQGEHPTPMLAFSSIMTGFGHAAMYDAKSLIALCRAAGFRQVRERRFADTDLAVSPDSLERKDESLYVEARK